MTKAQYDEIVQIYKETIENQKETIKQLRADKDILQTQVLKLQDGLMAVRAPEAYRDHRMDELGLEPAPVDSEAAERGKVWAETTRKHLESIERPLFENSEDMLDQLSHILVTEGSETKPLHPNKES